MVEVRLTEWPVNEYAIIVTVNVSLQITKLVRIARAWDLLRVE